MNPLLNKLFLYYPATAFTGEFHFLYQGLYRSQQYQSTDSLFRYQLRQFTALLGHAVHHKPYYRRMLPADAHLDCRQIHALEDFQRFYNTLPVLTKQDLIGHHQELSGKVHLSSRIKTTGGSTGEPVKLYKNASALARERVATALSYEWAGIQVGAKQARFWGIPHSNRAKFMAGITDLVANRYRLSAFDMTDADMAGYYRHLLVVKPAYLYGYVSAIRLFANYIKHTNLAPLPSLKAVITTSEVLSELDRHDIEQGFAVKVFNEYGCGEVGSIAHECEQGALHVMASNLLVQVERDGITYNHGTGEIVLTDLHNYATPLIRYKLGDYATLAPGGCSCGRGLPVLSRVHGRAYDIIHTPEGRSIHPEAIIYIFEKMQEQRAVFKQFQVLQDRLDHLTIRIIPTANFNNTIGRDIQVAVRTKISAAMQISLELVNTIEREKSGKLRVVKSQLTADDNRLPMANTRRS